MPSPSRIFSEFCRFLRWAFGKPHVPSGVAVCSCSKSPGHAETSTVCPGHPRWEGGDRALSRPAAWSPTLLPFLPNFYVSDTPRCSPVSVSSVLQEVKVFTEDGTCKVVEILADMTARDLCQLLVYRSHCVDDNSWTLVEHHPHLGIGMTAPGVFHELQPRMSPQCPLPVQQHSLGCPPCACLFSFSQNSPFLPHRSPWRLCSLALETLTSLKATVIM